MTKPPPFGGGFVLFYFPLTMPVVLSFLSTSFCFQFPMDFSKNRGKM
jgi:ABC-type spermidine/putrescine transport system permease subunit II